MVPGRLPEEGEVRIGPVALPAGVHIIADYGAGQPVAWATIEPVPEPYQIWAALSAAHAQTGAATRVRCRLLCATTLTAFMLRTT